MENILPFLIPEQIEMNPNKKTQHSRFENAVHG